MKTVNDERAEWLKELKVGDEVCVKSYHGQLSINTITKITPTRRLTVGQTKFDNEGRQMGGGWNSLSIYPITPEIKDQVWRTTATRMLTNYKWSDLSTQQLLNVLKIVQEAKPDA